ncbi:hypothetical protein GE061_005290 [Apolygus lucorum]|uniref:Protein kinase domain-containing protein n=1 Tax=Apolygus lucorum TaxID=248454 RepID=A0A6A4IK19_APOLU|nr:hypothetical protein GE061_005290 [Apolygus lucorum]
MILKSKFNVIFESGRGNRQDYTPPRSHREDRRHDNERCATAGSIRPLVRNYPGKRSGSSGRVQYTSSRSKSGKRRRGVSSKDDSGSDSEYESTEASRKYDYTSSSSASYNTGLSTRGSNTDGYDVTSEDESKRTKRRGLNDSDLDEDQEMALKKALDDVTWETMKQSEMIRKIVEEESYRTTTSRTYNSSFPGRAQLAELEERGYALSEKIGSGSYANVYIAHYTDPVNRKKLDLACKLCDRSAAPPDVVKKFLPREIEVLTTLNHPYVIQLHSILQQHDKMYIFMRYAENGDLLEWIRRHGVLKEQHAKIWFRQLVMGLDYLHSREIVHRDLKCENVLLTKRNNIKIADFGFARFCVEDGKRILSTTFCGSAAYAAPEVVSASPYNPKIADVWSLGIILFIMLNGTMPFDDSNLQKLLTDQMERNWSFRRSLKKTISPEGKEIVTKILEPDTIRRMYLDKIQKTNYFRMAQEIKRYKSFKNYCAEFMKSLNRLYGEPTRKKEGISDNAVEGFSRKEKYPAADRFCEGSDYGVNDGI